MIKLSDIKSNPNNPRLIKDEKFKKLVNSIKEFPKMMDLRPIIIDNDSMILGGNMRLKALLELKYSEVPNEWIKKAKDLTEEETKRFVIADNVGDCVGDTAGMGADIYESYVGAMMSAVILGNGFLEQTLPVVLSSIGLFSSLAGLLITLKLKSEPATMLRNATYFSMAAFYGVYCA